MTQLSQSKECKKLVKGFKAKKMTPEKMLKQLKSFEGPGDSAQATKAVNLLECSGWDDQCQAAVTSIVGATCVYEVGAILTWAAANNKFANGTFVFNADTDTSQIKESLGECCDGKLTAACCTSLSTMSAEYGRVGWSGGCFCEEEALEIVFGPTQKTTGEFARTTSSIGFLSLHSSLTLTGPDVIPPPFSLHSSLTLTSSFLLTFSQIHLRHGGCSRMRRHDQVAKRRPPSLPRRPLHLSRVLERGRARRRSKQAKQEFFF